MCYIYRVHIPELQNRGINTIQSGSGPVHLDKIKVKGINFFPHSGKVHCLRMTHFPAGFEHRTPVEVGSHNTLQCSETGRVFDPTLGQLSGTMEPKTFPTLKQYEAEFRGSIIAIFDSSQDVTDGQKQRDIQEATIHRNPQIHPSIVAKRVVDNFLSGNGGSTYCANCLGVASVGSKLLRCAKCKAVLYCSKTCQTMEWRSHKEVCKDD